MATVFGPALRKTGGYGNDCFAPKSGLLDGPTYRRIEDAIYAHRVEARDDTVLCRTLDEFGIHLVTRAEIRA
jgi:hypothetical protein